MIEEAETVREAVRHALEPHQPNDYRLLVLDRFRHNDDWWEFVVQPDREIARAYDYYDILAQTENELEEQGFNILLVPVLPGD